MKIVTLVAIKVIHKKHGVFERAVKKPPCWVIHARRLYLSRQLVIYSRVHIQPWWGTCSFPFPLHFSNLQNIVSQLSFPHKNSVKCIRLTIQIVRLETSFLVIELTPTSSPFINLYICLKTAQFHLSNSMSPIWPTVKSGLVFSLIVLKF